MISEFNVTSPANEYELGEALRGQSLTNRILELTVTREADELSVRRGTPTEPRSMWLSVEEIHLKRPTYILGRVAIDEVFHAARLEATTDEDDDRNNKLRLFVVE